MLLSNFYRILQAEYFSIYVMLRLPLATVVVEYLSVPEVSMSVLECSWVP